MREIWWMVLGLMLGAGCEARPVNPSLPLSLDEARAAREQLGEARLSRPVVIVNGYLDPGIGSWLLRQRLEAATVGQPIISVSLVDCATFAECRDKIVETVDRRLEQDGTAGQMPEVDVIGISMGGLAAAHSATAPDGRRLNIRRLFTLSSPWRGAEMADLPTFNPIQRQMREDSQFIADIAERELPFEVYPYVGLDDPIVGEDNAAPVGMAPIWVSVSPLRPAHSGAIIDDRIVLDIVLRLTERDPVSILPPAPLP